MTSAPQAKAHRFDRGLLQFYIISFPFLSALGPAVWLPLPTVIALFAALVYVANGRFWHCLYFEKDDGMLAIVLLLGIIAILFNYQYAGSKNLNYLFWVVGTFAVPLIWGRAWMRLTQITPRQIGAAATVGLLIASLAVVIEFILVNTTGHYLSDIIPFSTPSDELPQASVLLTLMRPRGLAAEPTDTAIVFEALAPLAWLYLRDKRSLLILVTVIALPGFLLCFSAGGFVSLFIAAAVVMTLRGRMGRIGTIVCAVIAVLAIVVMTNPDAQWLYDQVVGRKIDDLAGAADVAIDTAAGREVVYLTAIPIIQHYPFGIGWGMIAQMFDANSHLPGVPQAVTRGMISLYLEVLVSAGIPGLLVFLTYLIKKATRLAKRSDADSTAVLFALLAVAIHHSIVLEFWYPMLWFLIGMADYLADADVITVSVDPNAQLVPAE